MKTLLTSTSPCDTVAIEQTIATVTVAIETSRARRKAQLREVALQILAGDRDLPQDLEDLEGILVELEHLKIIAEYAELKTILYSSPSRIATLHAQWESQQGILERARADYYAAASESRLPHHQHWDACATDFERAVDQALAALNDASHACAQQMTQAGEAKLRCDALERDYASLLFE